MVERTGKVLRKTDTVNHSDLHIRKEYFKYAKINGEDSI